MRFRGFLPGWRHSASRCGGLDPSAHRLLYFRIGKTPRAPLCGSIEASPLILVAASLALGRAARASLVGSLHENRTTPRARNQSTRRFARTLGRRGPALHQFHPGWDPRLSRRGRGLCSRSAPHGDRNRRGLGRVFRCDQSSAPGPAQAGRSGRSSRRHSGRLVVAVPGRRFGAGRGEQSAFPRHAIGP